MPRSSKWSFPFRWSNIDFVCISQLPMLATCLAPVLHSMSKNRISRVVEINMEFCKKYIFLFEEIFMLF